MGQKQSEQLELDLPGIDFSEDVYDGPPDDVERDLGDGVQDDDPA